MKSVSDLCFRVNQAIIDFVDFDGVNVLSCWSLPAVVAHRHMYANESKSSLHASIQQKDIVASPFRSSADSNI